MKAKYIPHRYVVVACIGLVLFVLTSRVNDFGILGIIGFTMMVYGAASAYWRSKILSDFWWYRLILSPLKEEGQLSASDLIKRVKYVYPQIGPQPLDHDQLIQRIEFYTSMLHSMGCVLVTPTMDGSTSVLITSKGESLLERVEMVI